MKSLLWILFVISTVLYISFGGAQQGLITLPAESKPELSESTSSEEISRESLLARDSFPEDKLHIPHCPPLRYQESWWQKVFCSRENLEKITEERKVLESIAQTSEKNKLNYQLHDILLIHFQEKFREQIIEALSKKADNAKIIDITNVSRVFFNKPFVFSLNDLGLQDIKPEDLVNITFQKPLLAVLYTITKIDQSLEISAKPIFYDNKVMREPRGLKIDELIRVPPENPAIASSWWQRIVSIIRPQVMPESAYQIAKKEMAAIDVRLEKFLVTFYTFIESLKSSLALKQTIPIKPEWGIVEFPKNIQVKSKQLAALECKVEKKEGKLEVYVRLKFL